MEPIAILLPVYNDWECIQQLLTEIEVWMAVNNINADVWIVDDGSSIEPIIEDGFSPFTALKKVEIIRLVRNLGHQRGISIGLSYLVENFNYEAVVIMDADGEDKPEDILKLIDAWKKSPDDLIFAQRGKRHESVFFKFSYRIYQILFRFLTGQNIQNGNFCLIPHKRLKQIVTMTEIWNHFSVGLQKAKISKKYVLCERGQRYAGPSKMKFVSLIIHGLSSISIYSDIVGVRAILASLSLMGVLIIASITVICIRLFSDWSIPGWATYTLGLLTILIFQLFILMIIFSFLVLSQRSTSGFIPIQDYKIFIFEITSFYRSFATPRYPEEI